MPITLHPSALSDFDRQAIALGAVRKRTFMCEQPPYYRYGPASTIAWASYYFNSSDEEIAFVLLSMGPCAKLRPTYPPRVWDSYFKNHPAYTCLELPKPEDLPEDAKEAQP